MEGHGLSHGERRALYVIEEALRQEAAGLDRRLRTMTPRWGHRLATLACRPLAHLALLLGTASVVLLVTGIRTSSIAVIWAFSACCTVTFLRIGRLSCARRAKGPARLPQQRRKP
jgi:Protein of unknown function (DUF3040)